MAGDGFARRLKHFLVMMVMVLAGCETTHIRNGVVVSGGSPNEVLAQFRLADVKVNFPADHRQYYVASISREVFRDTSETGLRKLWAAASPEGLAITRERIGAHLTPHTTRTIAPLLTGPRPVDAVINVQRLLVVAAVLAQSPDDMMMTATLELIDQQTGFPITETQSITVFADGSIQIAGPSAPQTGNNRYLSDIGDKFAVRAAGALPAAANESSTRFE